MVSAYHMGMSLFTIDEVWTMKDVQVQAPLSDGTLKRTQIHTGVFTVCGQYTVSMNSMSCENRLMPVANKVAALTAKFIMDGGLHVDFHVQLSNSGWRGNFAELFSHPKNIYCN